MENVNPKELMDKFRDSPQVSEAVTTRFEAAHKRNPNITVDEVADSFFNRTEARSTFWRFYNEFKRKEFGGNNPEFDLDQLPEDFKTSLHNYFDQIRKNESLDALDKTAGDNQRTMLHGEAASLLVKHDVAPTFTFGRILVHLMAVSEGLDQADPDREDKKNTAQRKR
jgi:hypothetical protein